MKAIDNLDFIIHRNIQWLKEHPESLVFLSQRESLAYLCDAFLQKEKQEYESYRTLLPYYNLVNSPLNNFSFHILELRNWFTHDSANIDISKIKLRIKALKNLVQARGVMSEDEEQKVRVEFQNRVDAPIRKILQETKDKDHRETLMKKLNDANQEVKDAKAKLDALKSEIIGNSAVDLTYFLW